MKIGELGNSGGNKDGKLVLDGKSKKGGKMEVDGKSEGGRIK